MKRLFTLILLVLLFGSCSKNNSSDLAVTRLRCNNLENPPGVDRDPVLSWIIASGTRGAGQTAYQIILDKDIANLESENNCYWNSGKISSPQSAWINYSGPALEPGTGYYWKVRLWDNNDSIFYHRPV
jgi:alpha-L-rhamnosidase